MIKWISEEMDGTYVMDFLNKHSNILVPESVKITRIEPKGYANVLVTFMLYKALENKAEYRAYKDPTEAGEK